MKSVVLTTTCLLLSLLAASCASQSDVVILDERLRIIERSNQLLNKQNLELKKQISTELKRFGETSETTETTLRSNYAGLNANLDGIQQELRLSSGRIDEISHKLDTKIESYDKLQEQLAEIKISMAKLDSRVLTLEQYLSIEESKSRSVKKSAKTAAKGEGSKKGDTVQALYEEAKQAFDNGQLDKARQGFQKLLKDYPKSTMADNAQYWIGETYFREKWFEKAILEYQAVIENYPKGNKVTAAMLKQGIAFLELGDKANARLILKELVKKHPKSNEAKIASKKLTEF